MGQLCTLGGLSLPNVEVYEHLYPMRILMQEFRLDSAGAGEFRGGTGIHYVAEMDMPAEYSFRGEGARTPTGYGILGGLEGARG